MKVRATANMSGPSGHIKAGEELTVTQELGQELISRRVALPVQDKPAVKVKVEKASDEGQG